MTSIDVVAACSWGVRALRLALVPRNPLDEGVLFVRVSFPQEASHLVVADANAFEQIFDPGGGIPDTKGGFDPVANLVGVAKATGADLCFELGNLLLGQIAWVALVVDFTKGVEPFLTKDTQPFAQLAEAHTQQGSDVFAGFARSDRQDGGQTLVQPSVQAFLPSSLDGLALLCRNSGFENIAVKKLTADARALLFLYDVHGRQTHRRTFSFFSAMFALLFRLHRCFRGFIHRWADRFFPSSRVAENRPGTDTLYINLLVCATKPR